MLLLLPLLPLRYLLGCLTLLFLASGGDNSCVEVGVANVRVCSPFAHFQEQVAIVIDEAVVRVASKKATTRTLLNL